MPKLNVTSQQQAHLLELPDPVIRVFVENPSVAENYLEARNLPMLPDSYKSGLFEIYYDCAKLPRIVIDNGVVTTNPQKIDAPPIIETLTDLGMAFMQVAGFPILDRLGDALPDIKAVIVSV
jgi:hypothetical protein